MQASVSATIVSPVKKLLIPSSRSLRRRVGGHNEA